LATFGKQERGALLDAAALVDRLGLDLEFTILDPHQPEHGGILVEATHVGVDELAVAKPYGRRPQRRAKSSHAGASRLVQPLEEVCHGAVGDPAGYGPCVFDHGSRARRAAASGTEARCRATPSAMRI
jgi:hypothetical protein